MAELSAISLQPSAISYQLRKEGKFFKLKADR
jgi:hypothetical protein